MREKIKNYSVCSENFWYGRIDDPEDRESFRMHQVIKPLDLNNIRNHKKFTGTTNFCLLGFKSDEGVRRNLGRTGASKGPEMIKREFANMPVTFGIDVNIYDGGDIICKNGDLEYAQEQLASAVKLLLGKNLFPVILGGGHSVALGNYNGIKEHLYETGSKKNIPGIINFDAHLDFRPFDKGGSSGSMFYQIADKNKTENQEFRYLCIGAQTYSNTISLFKRTESYGGEYILAKDILGDDQIKTEGKVDEFVLKNEHIHLTLCCDVFNSAFAPGVSAPQPFGLDPEIVLTLIKQILRSGRVVSFDIAEVSPRFDHDNITAKLAAVIIYAVLNTMIDKYQH
ncbi:MAG: formimidoylglutamase [Acidobacteriota bacterium]